MSTHVYSQAVVSLGAPYKYLPPPSLVLLPQEFELPGIGSVGGFSGTRKSKEMFFSFTSELELTRHPTPSHSCCCDAPARHLC